MNGGNGLVDSSGSAPYEKGWVSAWDTQVSLTDATLTCTQYAAWTSTPSTKESRAFDCADWYQSYAFCIWDGGFLPSDAELNYAESGGAEQRLFPWSSPPSSSAADCSYAYFHACGLPDGGTLPSGFVLTNDVGAESPKGDGKYGQADLVGSEMEFTLDRWMNYVVPCIDCAFVDYSFSGRVLRGSSYSNESSMMFSANRLQNPEYLPGHAIRCARSP